MFPAAALVAPFIAVLGYVWVDIFQPQQAAYSIFSSFPPSLLMAIFAIAIPLAYQVLRPPKDKTIFTLICIFALWTCLTTLWAYVPLAAWAKWDWAFKVMVFAAFLPWVVRTRLQIEALVHVYCLSMSVHIVAAGTKTILTGGGYGLVLGVVNQNSGLGEGSTFATASLMTLPLCTYLAKYNTIIPAWLQPKYLYFSIATLALIAALGTFARTGLIGLAVLGVGYIFVTKRKATAVTCMVLVAIAVAYLGSDAWRDRMSTIQNYNSEESAFGRILVWRWTWEFVLDHPVGGGFDVFRLNEILHYDPVNDRYTTAKAKAFHSIYFEVLGEQGFPGLIIYLMLLGATAMKLFNMRRAADTQLNPEWSKDLAGTLLLSLTILSLCGLFIGIAYQAIVFYLFALTSALYSATKENDQPMSDIHARSSSHRIYAPHKGTVG